MEVWAPDAAARGSLASDPSRLLRDYGDLWLEDRKTRGRELRPTTRQQYRMLLDTYIYPTFGDERIDRITVEDVNKWYDALAPGKETVRAQAYSLLRTIFGYGGLGATEATDPVQPGAHPRRRQHQAGPQGPAGHRSTSWRRSWRSCPTATS